MSGQGRHKIIHIYDSIYTEIQAKLIYCDKNKIMVIETVGVVWQQKLNGKRNENFLGEGKYSKLIFCGG